MAPRSTVGKALVGAGDSVLGTHTAARYHVELGDLIHVYVHGFSHFRDITFTGIQTNSIYASYSTYRVLLGCLHECSPETYLQDKKLA